MLNNESSTAASAVSASEDRGSSATAPNAAPSANSQEEAGENAALSSDAVGFLALLEGSPMQGASPNLSKATADANRTAPGAGGNTANALSAQLANTLDTAVTTNSGSGAASAPAGLAPSQSSTPAVQIVAASPLANVGHGESLLSVLQQFQDLLASSSTGLSPSSGVIELTRANGCSQVAAVDGTAAFGVTEHASALGSAAMANISKDFQRVQPETPASQPTPSAAASALASASPHSTTQNSSSDSNKQSSSDSGDSTNLPDASFSNSQFAKPLVATFSDALAANAVGHADAAQSAPAPAPAPSQILIPPTAGSSNHPAATETLPSAPAQPAPPALPSLHAPDTTGGRFVNDAELTNATNQSEMRIALQTDKLGAIELRARVTGDELGAAIIVEKRDAHAALAVELPALQQTLSEKQLRVDQVVLTQGSLHATAGDAGANAQQGQRGGGQTPRQTPLYANDTAGLQQAAWFVPEAVGIFDSQGRLSVQA